MGSQLPESLGSLALANEFISSIARCTSETEVVEATLAIVNYFALQVFGFVIMARTQNCEHYRYLVGCDLRLCYRYLKNKWHAIDPFISYALHNTSPVLASDMPNNSEGQRRMRADAGQHGFRGGIAIPAHSSSSSLVGILYLGTDEGPERARQSLITHRNLMRALAMELLEWWDAKQCAISRAEFMLDDLDVELLRKARDHVTAEVAAQELGITSFCVDSRYERLNRKLQASCKRNAVEKAVSLGLIKPI